MEASLIVDTDYLGKKMDKIIKAEEKMVMVNYYKSRPILTALIKVVRF